jgi:cysteinyl-tRNA synthetase
MVTVEGQKMGKSLNNFINLKQAFSGSHERLSRSYDPLAVRQLVLTSHYRSPLDFSDAALSAAQSGYDKITSAVIALRKAIDSAPKGDADKEIISQLEQLKAKFEEAMNDDLNTSVALSVIFDMTRLSNALLEKPKTTEQTLKAVDEMFTKLGGEVLGIVKTQYAESSAGSDELLDHLIGVLIEQRNNARKNKDYAASDAIRNKLDELGIVLEDKTGTTGWRRK